MRLDQHMVIDDNELLAIAARLREWRDIESEVYRNPMGATSLLAIKRYQRLGLVRLSRPLERRVNKFLATAVTRSLAASKRWANYRRTKGQ